MNSKNQTGLMLNLPNPRSLMGSLRSSGYTAITSLLDLIDNCLDAKASRVIIDYFLDADYGDGYSIIIADNGTGMPPDILDQALKLGSERERSSTQKGKYGLGLNTASMAQCKKVSVITKALNCPTFYSSQDLDLVIEKNEFVKEFSLASKQQEGLWRKYLGNSQSGTLVILSKIDRIDQLKIPNLMRNLEEEIARVYRKAIEQGLEFTIRDSSKKNKVAYYNVEAYDPLFLNKSILLFDREVLIPVRGHKVKLGIKFAILPMTNDYLNSQRPSVSTQGFYILRNDREVEHGSKLFLPGHNQDNYFRIEISYSGEDDQFFETNFRKDGINLDSYLLSSLRQLLGPYFIKARKMTESNPAAKEQREKQDKSIREILSAVFAARSDLICPNLEKDKKCTTSKPKLKLSKEEETGSKDDKKEESSEARKTAAELGAKLSNKSDRFPDLAVEFESLTEKDPFARYDLENGILLVTINDVHPFFQLTQVSSNPSQLLYVLVIGQALSELNLIQGSEDDRLVRELMEKGNLNLSLNLAAISNSLLE